ncbi:hypothetical protein [Pseudonocardia spinosispora]|uniref:hypothetical protein n=1 Tax=Pseudonocardia spinosispora TaxID=103441 RepID=UPI0007E8DA0E|nr:hypothetical protein [Pseudonocardia spinosispora]
MIVIVVIILAVFGLVIYQQARKRRSEQLQNRFGPEYERKVEDTGDPKQAEAQLLARKKRHDELELKELDEGQRRQYEQRWSDVQREFVDDPSGAVRKADGLVVDVMSARGYPVDDFDRRAEDLSVKYPVVTQNYREARQIARANRNGEASTEDLRNAVTHYRSLVDALVRDTDQDWKNGSEQDIPRARGNRDESARADGRVDERVEGKETRA